MRKNVEFLRKDIKRILDILSELEQSLGFKINFPTIKMNVIDEQFHKAIVFKYKKGAGLLLVCDNFEELGGSIEFIRFITSFLTTDLDLETVFNQAEFVLSSISLFEYDEDDEDEDLELNKLEGVNMLHVKTAIGINLMKVMLDVSEEEMLIYVIFNIFSYLYSANILNKEGYSNQDEWFTINGVMLIELNDKGNISCEDILLIAKE